MGELREWITLLLSPVLIPVFFAARKAWQQWRKKHEATRKLVRRETRRADTYQAEGEVAIDTLERENEELQLELEASELAAKEARQAILSMAASLERLSKAYERLAGGKGASA